MSDYIVMMKKRSMSTGQSGYRDKILAIKEGGRWEGLVGVNGISLGGLSEVQWPHKVSNE